MKIYNFSRLVEKYSNDIELKSEEAGSYNGGRYVRGQVTTQTVRGAIIPYTTEKIYQSGGYIKSTDLQLYTLYKIDLASRVSYKGRTYKVEEDSDYSDYSDVYVYRLIWMEGLSE